MATILVSACLLGDNVRYDGGNSLIEHAAIKNWLDQGRIVKVCPEREGGLPVPRPAAEIISRFPPRIMDANQNDFTSEFLDGAERARLLAKQHKACCALMKSKSPSCSNGQVYDGSFSRTLTDGPGIAAAELLQYGIPVFNEHQLTELVNFVAEFDKSSLQIAD